MNLSYRRMPALVGAAAFLLYLLTLSWGVTANSLGLTARVAGWDWQPLVGQPVLWLLTSPLRVLPAAWVPVLLNLFSALCAAVTLGMLARIMELLPWQRPLAAFSGWRQKLPIWVAVMVCGLEFSFWQNATAATGETLDVLLFTVPIWCLLEFRVSQNVRWYHAAAIGWGLGMAENWMMILTLPFFVLALLMLRPFEFLKPRYVLKLAALGLAGVSIYAFSPLANWLLPGSPVGFGDAWLLTLKQTKQLLLIVYVQFFRAHRLVGIAVLIFYLLPVLACLVRLQDEETDNKSFVDQLQIWFLRGLRVVLLLVSLWLALGPVVGPQGIIQEQLKLTLPCLSFDLLNGIGAGFLLGSLIMIRRPGTAPRYFQPGSFQLVWLERSLPVLVIIASVATLVLTLTRNLPPILAVNRQPLTQLADVAVRSLPPGGGVMLSDYSDKLAVFQAAQAHYPAAKNWRVVDVTSLPSPAYRQWLQSHQPGDWMTGTNEHFLAPIEMMRLIMSLTRSNQVFYLHPTFGYFLEANYLVPNGPVYQFKPFETNVVNPPALSSEQLKKNDDLWRGANPRIESLLSFSPGAENPLLNKIQKKLHLTPADYSQTVFLKDWYSMALNSWGVDLQRAGRLPEARQRFEQAVALNANNWIARANLFCNTNLQATNGMNLTPVAKLASQLGNLKNFSFFLSRFGPVDEPAFCFLLGSVYAQTSLPRMAMQQFERSAALAPDVMAPQLVLASLYCRYQMADQADAMVARLKREIVKLPASDTNLPDLNVQLSFLEAEVMMARTNLTGVRQALNDVVRRNPDNPAVAEKVLQAFVRMNDFTNAEEIINTQLARTPDRVDLQFAQAALLVQSGKAAAAIPILNQILEVTNNPAVRLNRAVAYLQTTNYDAAEKDYRELADSGVNPLFIKIGLSQVALGRGDTNQAVAYLSECLSNLPAASREAFAVREKINALKNPATNSITP